ncbi:MAG TPA: HAD family hydrolase [Streptosporangiaceae bacterium]|nr:HAD family hydrolase [Streptosporangiaceae bacterium]
MSVSAVIFDWGGTLTPWHTIDEAGLWRAVCVQHYEDSLAAQTATTLRSAELELWDIARREQRSATLQDLLSLAGVLVSEEFLESYFRAWEPHTFTDPDAGEVLRELRRRGIKVGVLSNTMWPRARHELIFARDGVLDLIDGAVYSCEIPWTKPHPEAFRAAMAAVGAVAPGDCVYVGDRPFDDIHGAHAAGLRTVLVPNSDVPPFDGAVPDAVISRLAELPGVIDRW